MKRKMLLYDRVIVLIIVVGILSLVITWKYYGYKNDQLKVEMIRLDKKI